MQATPPIPSLGAYLIVRDAADTVADALVSLRSVVSQIVVVDTGSVDATPALCTRLGADVHFFAWNDNFSDARNHALGLMRADWVLALDADETVDAASLADARSLMTDPGVGGLRVSIHNRLSTDGTAVSVHRYPRIFRRRPEIRYRGAVHEQIGDAIAAAGFVIVDSPVVIRHYGYAAVSPEKIARNAALLRAELAREPNDPWLHYHLGLTEFAAQRHDEARRHLLEALQAGTLSDEQLETARIRLAQIALGREDWQEFEKRISFTGSDEHREGFRRYLDAVRSVVCGDYGRALPLLTSALVERSGLVDREQLHTLRELCRRRAAAQQQFPT